MMKTGGWFANILKKGSGKVDYMLLMRCDQWAVRYRCCMFC